MAGIPRNLYGILNMETEVPSQGEGHFLPGFFKRYDNVMTRIR